MEENNLGNVEQTITEPVINNEKKGLSIGWLILGFFFPLVGLILFFVFKNKNKRASKGAGLGALIGFGLEVIATILFVVFSFGLIGGSNKIEGIPVKIKEYTKENNKYSFDIEDYHYIADWSDDYYDFQSSEDKIVTVLNNRDEILFKIEEFSVGEDITYYIRLNNGESVEAQENILLLLGEYDFYYTGDLLIFNVGKDNDEYYFYDYKADELIRAISSSIDSDAKGMSVTNIKLDNEDVIFELYVNILDSENSTSGKSSIVLNYDNGTYKTLEDLQTALNDKNLGDFVLSKVYTFKRISSGYKKPTIDEKTIIEALKEGKGKSTDTASKDCVGKVKQGSNKYEYIIYDKENKTEYADCKTLTAKVNDNFTIKYERNDSLSPLEIVYINNNKFETTIYDSDKIYIIGKTMVANIGKQTDGNSGYSVALINTKGEAYNFAANPSGEGGEVNKLVPTGSTDISLIDNGIPIEKQFKVTNQGELVINGKKYRKMIEDDYLGQYAQEERTCKLSVDEVAKAYNSTPDSDFITEYTYKVKSDGLIDFNNPSKKTIKTIREAYKEFCK